MTTMTETGLVHTPHEVVGGQLSHDNALDYNSLPDVDLKQSTIPLFSQQLLTVEQLIQVTVDPDIQTSVDHFLKGLSDQMFARIVRNGSAEVGKWLGAKVQSERDGWTALLRMAMNHIELHRKNALQGQVVLHNMLEQLLMLLDCFQLGEDVKRELLDHNDDVQGIHSCLELLADCCNTLMEDRFQCITILGCSNPVPDMVATAVQELKDKVALKETEKDSLKKQLSAFEAETSKVRKQNEQFFEEIQKMEEKMTKKHEDLEVLKAQLKEIDKMVKFRKNNTSDKCVGTTVGMFKPSNRPPLPSALSSKTRFKSVEDISRASWTSREHVYTQTLREPSLIEVSEEKLRVLKERAKQLESSLHGAIATMDKLRRAAPGSEYKPPSSPSSSAFTTATFVALPSQRETRANPKSWMTASFQVTNTVSSSVTAPVPKLGHFQPTERRCFSERPAAKAGDENDVNQASTEKVKGDSRKTSRSRTNQVSKCLRCQKLFTATDNHKLACCFHSKSKERMEVYNDDGQLVRVQYVWKCCHQKGDNDGCCYGQHV
ncbi:uncharacterized protein LOC143290888 [Babylonia areolata]|uniref:uncharacterized protein LOC143290888 n=1 Tax=Babylonia areolata TaxID=304850 RepID=UPI003FD60F6E